MNNGQLTIVLRQIRKLVAAQTTERIPDGDLLGRFVRNRDEVAFAALVDRHGGMVLRVCRRVLQHDHDAEDACQATFVILARKAASIQKKDSLGSWLHGVACNLATRLRRDLARRHARKERAAAVSRQDLPVDVSWREVQLVLDEELHRLPKQYQDPLVLCYMEGETQDRAAERLRCSLATLKRRLERGRELLRGRLVRRGLTLSAALFGTALAQDAASAEVPATLMISTVKIATSLAAGNCAAGVVISPTVATLIQGVNETMFVTKLKTAIVLCLLLAGVIALGGMMMSANIAAQPPGASLGGAPNAALNPEEQAVQPRTPGVQSQVSLQEMGDTIALNARVIDPDGKPIAGAEITLWYHFGYSGLYARWHPRTNAPFKPRHGATTDTDGRFRFTFAKSEIVDNPLNIWEKPWLTVQIVAAAKGYGPAWTALEGMEKGELTLQLVKDVPISGRVVDLQGRPVVGARVGIERVTRSDQDEHHSLWQTSWLGLSADVLTDRDGRFVLNGVGRDRTVVLHIDGSSIEHKVVAVSTQARKGSATEGIQVEVIAGPTKPITGTIRAKDTSKPLAGVVVYGQEEGFRRRVRAVTDENGRYELLGLPKAGQYELTVYPSVSQSYLSTQTRVGDSEGLRPIAANFELRRGVPVKCRFIDKETREPVRGDLHYTPLAPNPYYHEAGSAAIPTREFFRVHVPDSDGFFHLVAYPGLGMVALLPQRNNAKYLPGRLDPADEEKAKGDPHVHLVSIYKGHRLIEPVEGGKPVALEIELDPGHFVNGSLIGPDSKPVASATAYGLNYHAENQRHFHPPWSPAREMRKLDTDAFTAQRLEPQTPRTVSFLHKDRKLIGYRVLLGDEPGPIRVQLDSWGSVTGRFVDAEGRPLAGVGVQLRYPSLPAPGILSGEQESKTDGEGRFRLDGLVPGLKHELTLTRDKKAVVLSGGGGRLKDLVVSPGQVKDLAEVPLVEKKTGGAGDE